ncbi:DUF5683 domain-containing protein [Flavitalea flava]
MKRVWHFLLLGSLLLLQTKSFCQQKENDTIPSFIKGKEGVGINVTDTLKPKKENTTDSPYKVDSATRKKHDPHKATLYSTFCPGLGQIYNRKYWKLPLVYAAVGIPAYTFFYNKSWYQKCQYALAVVLNGTTDQDSLNKVDPHLSSLVKSKDDNAIRTYRNEYRKDQDYSVLFFLLFWGLQIVDATVDAHLMNFDISSELSFHLTPGSSAQSNVTGVGVAFELHKPRYKPIPLP